MRAVRYERYGGPEVLAVADVPEGVPAAGEVRVRVEAASLNPLDWKLRAGHLRFLPVVKPPPRVTGCDFAGVIVAVGGGPGSRHVGERVFGSLSPFGREGSCAESCIVAASRLAAMPDTLAFDAAACLPVAGGSAVQALADDAKLTAGQRVLITGAAGGVGHFAVQYARHLGAHVTGVCSTANLPFVAELGAERVVDYTTTDPGTLGERYDVVFDAGAALDWRRARALLVRGGLYLGTAGSLAAAVGTGVGSVLAPLVAGVRARNFALRADAQAWQRLAGLAARGVLKPVIRRRIGLDGVAAAQAEMASGHGRGKIVVLPATP